ncbi:LysR substrate-binding domain-containing protein [Roseomonas sp. WA12]
METRRLEYFVFIVDVGSITKAAAQIGIAQPALSQQLAILEAEFKTKLVDRTPQGVEPTAAGTVLYQTARIVLRHIERARDAVKLASATPSGPASVGLPISTAMLLSMPLLQTMRSRYPNIQLQITEGLSGHLRELLIRARLDVALLFEALPTPGLTIEQLWCEELLLIAPANCSLPDPISLEMAASLPLIMPATGNGARTVLDAVLARHALTPKIAAEIDSIATLKRAVEAGLGYTFLPWAAVHQELAESRLSALAVEAIGLQRMVSLCTPSGLPPTAAAELLAHQIRDQVAELLKSRRIRGVRPPG